MIHGCQCGRLYCRKFMLKFIFYLKVSFLQFTSLEKLIELLPGSLAQGSTLTEGRVLDVIEVLEEWIARPE